MECSCDVNYDNYDNCEWQFLRYFRRTAKKNHVCCECKRTINKKEEYGFFKGLLENEFLEYKTCHDCESLIDQFFKYGYTFGHIWDDFNTHIDIVNGAIPEKCISNLTKNAINKVCDSIQSYWEYQDDLYGGNEDE